MSAALQQALTEALYNYCSSEIIEKFKVSSAATKNKWLEALKTVFDRATGDQAMLMLGRQRDTRQSNLEFQRKTDPILIKTLKLMGCKILIDLNGLKRFLVSWGKVQSRQTALSNYYMSTLSQNFIKMTHQKQIATTNSTVTKAEGSKCDISKLKETSICDLQLFEVAKGKFIRGELITPPSVTVGVYTYLEDRNGDCVKLGLYNMIPSGKDKEMFAQMKFPVGASIVVSEPFYKIFADGELGIRVDSPDEISMIQDERTLSFDTIKEKGRVMVKSGDYLGALELYLGGLSQFQEVELLLNNRCQCELKLGCHEDALLDAAAVLFLNCTNTKARMRYENARHGIKVDGIFDLWKKLLSLLTVPLSQQHKFPGRCTRESGNVAFKHGKFPEARQIYSQALTEFGNIAVLLNNIAIVSLKSEMYHTAISAANACLRSTADEQQRKKAFFSMTKSFVMLGELELAKLSAGDDTILQRCYTEIKDAEEVLNDISFKIDLLISSGGFEFKEIKKSILEGQVPNEYVSDAIEYFFSRKERHGIKAKRHLSQGEVILVDRIIACADNTLTEEDVTLVTLNSNSRVMTMGNAGADFKNMMLRRLKYDGLMGKKLLFLEESLTDENRTIIDLSGMGYQSLSRDISPFLPQSPIEVGLERMQFSTDFMEDRIIEKHCFTWIVDDKDSSIKCGLPLRLSLIRKHNFPNCAVIPAKESFVLLVINDVKEGEELTVKNNC